MGLKKFPEQFLRSQEMGLFKKNMGPKRSKQRNIDPFCVVKNESYNCGGRDTFLPPLNGK